MSSVSKARRSVIHLGDIPVDVFQLPDASYRLSQKSCAGAIDLPTQYIANFLDSTQAQALLSKHFGQLQPDSFDSPGKTVSERLESFDSNSLTDLNLDCHSALIPVEGTRTRVSAISMDFALVFWGYWAVRGNKKAVALLLAVAGEVIQRRCDEAFGVARTSEEYRRQTAKRFSFMEGIHWDYAPAFSVGELRYQLRRMGLPQDTKSLKPISIKSREAKRNLLGFSFAHPQYPRPIAHDDANLDVFATLHRKELEQWGGQFPPFEQWLQDLKKTTTTDLAARCIYKRWLIEDCLKYTDYSFGDAMALIDTYLKQVLS